MKQNSKLSCVRDYLSPDVESLEMESQEILCVSSNFIEDMTFGEKFDGWN